MVNKSPDDRLFSLGYKHAIHCVARRGCMLAGVGCFRDCITRYKNIPGLSFRATKPRRVVAQRSPRGLSPRATNTKTPDGVY